jgi:predicted Zn-ribbon and HTH transcriptional regulator
MKKPPLEVADIFRQFSNQYIEKYKPPLEHLKVISAITKCRTSELGGHIESCSEGCGYQQISYNSCRNRHCPKCQFTKAAQWIQNRQDELLPIIYFHVVFTLPTASILPVILPNKKTFYTLMFKCVSQTLLELGADPNWLGAKIGATCVLHTWTQKMIFHPHIHCIVPGGGISFSQDQWISPKNPEFFVPFKVMAKLFQKKLLAGLKELHKKNKLSFFDHDYHLYDPREFDRFCQPLYAKEWIAYAKPSFNGPKSVIQYLGQYVHKIALSNWRLIKLEEDIVSFIYRDRKNGNIKKSISLHALEFMKRFLQHVLPYQFSKIRSYGFLANRCKKGSLIIVKNLLGISVENTNPAHPKEQLLMDSIQNEYSQNHCPNCRKGILIKHPLPAPLSLNPRPP